MFRYLLLLISFLSFFQLHSQRKHYSDVNCDNELRKSLKNIPDLFEQGKIDRIDSIIRNWKYQCGQNEYNVRLGNLLSISKDDFLDSDFDLIDYNALISYVEDEKFRILMDSTHESPRQLFLDYFGDPDLIFRYNEFTQKFASDLQAKLIRNASQRCDLKLSILNAYSNNFRDFSKSIRDYSCDNKISRIYRSQVRTALKKPQLDAAIIAGYWMPYGNNQILGSHPALGFIFGIGKPKIIYDLVFEFRFGSPTKDYTILYNGSQIQSNHFFGGYIGLDIDYLLIKKKAIALYGLGGFGMDGFDQVKGSQNVKGKSIFALNINTGVGCRFFAHDGSYLGVELRHNFVNYENFGGTDLSGNSFTAKLLIGLLKNDKRKRDLDYLDRF